MSYSISGLNEFLAAMNRGAEQIEKLVDTQLSWAAERNIAFADIVVPVRTGYLKSRLRAERKGEADYSAGDDAPYAGYVELGTRYMAPRPYLLPWVNQIAADLHTRIKQDLTEVLK